MKPIKEKVIEECAKREHWGTEDMIDITLREVGKVIDEISESALGFGTKEESIKLYPEKVLSVSDLKRKLGIKEAEE